MITQKPNCLLVDDLPENLFALKKLLERLEINIFTAQTGEEALELMLKQDFAVSLIDVQMPGMGGFELAEIMRSTEKTKHIPIIFVTAMGTNPQVEFKGYEAGAVDFLLKPLDEPIVLSKVKVFMDLYAQKQLLEKKIRKLRDTEESLKAALKNRDDFLSICSHELNTPLTALKLQLQILDKKQKSKDFIKEEVQQFIKHTNRSLERIIHLVNDMLDISRIESGKLSLDLTTFSMNEFISEICESLNPLARQSKNKLTFQANDTIIGKWDRFRLEQVLINLITNACKYAPGADINIELHKINDQAVISVHDNGPGIPINDQHKVFNRFERVSNANVISGLGLGLYIAKQIIELHKGTIELISSKDEGTLFKITLGITL